MPKKPTSPFGSISFSKSGKVVKDEKALSSNKEKQEEEVAKSFVSAFNEFRPDTLISRCIQLPENDHDFVLELGEQKVYLQVTELVDRSFTFPMTREEYDSGMWEEAILKEPSEIPWRIDTAKRDAALWELISKKLGKHYAKDPESPLWLLIFTTNSLYLTEYFSQGIQYISQALEQARTTLVKQPKPIFDEVWFTNMITKPVRIWPTF